MVGETRGSSSLETIQSLAVHLRMPFQLMLGPFFLLGAFVGGATPHPSWLVPFLAVHVALYGGATAYNSHHDRDEGPIGFLKRPPPVRGQVHHLALGLQAVGVVTLGIVRPVAGVLAAVMMAMGVAYSHPRWRWKASTWGGLIAVAIGQGALAVYVGAMSTGATGSPDLHAAAWGAALIALGIYPITQIYQIEEDARRGDRTLPVRVGWKAAMIMSWVVTSIGILLLERMLGARLPSVASLVLRGAPLGFGAVLALWAARFPERAPEGNHDWAMGTGLGASVLFWALLLGGFASR